MPLRPPPGAALACFVLLAGCPRPPAAPRLLREPAPLASLPVTPDAGEPVDATEVAATPSGGPWAAAWTDPAAVARLATSCDYHPPPDEDDEADPLECASSIEQQSCSYDPCHEDVDLPCRRVCGRTCGTCDGRCRGACGRCRAACHDEACVLSCATSCGQCLQACLTEKDRCLTAGCAARYAACARRSVEHFRRGPCLAACTRCHATCEGRGREGPCLERCLARTRGCTAEEVNHCTWDGPSYGADSSEEDVDAGAPPSP
ncbi:MAG: hypothetical protein Q8S73_14655 [Deltaproteobacteria bacterium]|nr:hypothetical protein [Myxococcales bacterium]MDP3215345.1 hypothetical protein [Deltaproteobacteria bacterium]